MTLSFRRDLGFSLIACALAASAGCQTDGTQSTSTTARGDLVVHESRAYPTGNRSTSALMLERVMPKEVVLGQPLEYEIRVQNITDLNMKDVIVTDECSGNFTITTSDPATEKSPSGAPTWRLGDLGPGESKVVKVTGKSPAAGKLTSCAAVTYRPQMCQSTDVVQPELKLTLTAPADATTCDNITLAMTVTNAGTGTARNVKVKVELPEGLRTLDGKSELEAGALSAGQSRQLTVQTRSDKMGEVSCRATAAADSGLTAAAETVKTKIGQPTLTITRKASPTQFIGRAATAEIVVTNTGDASARDLVVEDSLGSSATIVSATEAGRFTGGKTTWNIATLAPGQARTLSVSYSGAGEGAIEGTATAKAFCTTPVTATAATSVIGIAALMIEVMDASDPVAVGDEVLYIITVTNQGSASGTGIKVSCTIPPEQQYVSATGASAATLDGGKLTMAPIATLKPKAKATWNLTLKAVKKADSRFKVTLSADQLNSPVEEAESTNLFE